MTKKKILIVDDDAEFRENLGDVLRREGFAITRLGSAQKALERLADEIFDVILLDMVMPGMDGMTALDRIRSDNRHVKVIMITGFGSVDNAVEAMKKGADDYIQKPFRMDELIITIRRVLEAARFEVSLRNLNLDFTFQSLANPIRRKTLQLIGASQEMRLTDIVRALHVQDHTKVLFHLKKLKDSDIVSQNEDKTYTLTDNGRQMLELLSAVTKQIPSDS
ncbi:MAG: response regulator [Magnetococcales bacterium]|nr:response regulator [Magnetococcales bacterium]